MEETDLCQPEEGFCGGVPIDSLPIGDYKQIQCINYGGDTRTNVS